jgi:hypothetical protein
MELKEISIEAKSFEANGKTYFLEQKLSIERFIAYQKLEVELAYQSGFAGVMRSLKKGVEHLNKMQLVDAAVELTNTMDCMRKADKDKRQPAVDLCSLFLNTKDEDRRVITDEMLMTKQQDFETAGIPIDFFLHLATNLVSGYRQHLEKKE